jgi:hypothetical protein
MAKLVDVYLTEENNLIKKRQLPLDVDDNLTVSARYPPRSASLRCPRHANVSGQHHFASQSPVSSRAASQTAAEHETAKVAQCFRPPY